MFLFGGISGAFLCVPACFFWCGFPVFFVVLFLVSFGDFAGGIFCAFPGAFFTVFWCFFPCFFSCLSLFFSIYVSPWVVLFFAVLFFVVFGCFFRAFFRAFCGVFLVSFIVLFFVHFFVLFLVFFFRVFFFRALGGTRDKRPQYFAFWPVLFSVLFLVVTTSEDRIYTIYILFFPHYQSYLHIITPSRGRVFLTWETVTIRRRRPEEAGDDLDPLADEAQGFLEARFLDVRCSVSGSCFFLTTPPCCKGAV